MEVWSKLPSAAKTTIGGCLAGRRGALTECRHWNEKQRLSRGIRYLLMPYFFILLYNVTRLMPSSLAVLVRLKLLLYNACSMISRSVVAI